jgi:response regulator RpfG family c-di-GMP phosphodiesterase
LTGVVPNLSAHSSAVEHTRKLRVLLVDVAQVHHDLMDVDRALFQPFVTMDQASSLAQAIEKLSNNTYHAVVSEWRKPGDACAQLVRWMRSQDRLHRVALIVIAALNQRQDLQEALAAPTFELVLNDTLSTSHSLIDTFLVKPFRRQDLFNAVTTSVEKRRLRRTSRL